MGRLVVVGTGIRSGLQLTPEARREIRAADRVFYLVTEPLTSGQIADLNPSAESLHDLYAPSKDRSATYQEMVARVLAPVRRGRTVCVAFYGHPGVFVTPGHVAIDLARSEGHEALMLPGVSSEDCLFADLGIDPGADGCQSYTGNDFLVRPRTFDPRTPLILWQIIGIGDPAMRDERNPIAIQVLTETLLEHYGPGHEVVVYTAAVYPVGEFTAVAVSLEDLPDTDLPDLATLYVPPVHAADVDPDVVARLGLVGH